jgi:hypothetical protein
MIVDCGKIDLVGISIGAVFNVLTYYSPEVSEEPQSSLSMADIGTCTHFVASFICLIR